MKQQNINFVREFLLEDIKNLNKILEILNPNNEIFERYTILSSF